jgi:hypothetical protein
MKNEILVDDIEDILSLDSTSKLEKILLEIKSFSKVINFS